MPVSPSDPLRMPAEWTEHELTLIAWPTREEAWRGTSIEAARDTHAEVVAAVSEFEPVLLVADPKEADDARRRCPAGNVEVLPLPIDDSWLRDSGPLIVTGEDGGRAGVDFAFNAWGEAFTPYRNDAAVTAAILDHLGIERFIEPMVLEGGSIAVDGEGLLVTTKQCLLNPNRNPELDQATIDAEMSRALGVERVIWLEQGLVEDADTDGHVDNICAALAPGRFLIQTVSDTTDPNYANCRENADTLASAGVEVVEWELLPRIRRENGDPVVVPYTNFYVVNGALIVPVSGIDKDMDREALARLEGLYPGREAVGIDARVLALGGGGIHCIAQQVPLAVDSNRGETR